MRRILIGLVLAVVAAGAIMFSCSGEPGQREFDRAVREMEAGHHVRAKALFENSITRRPGSAENVLAYNYLGIICWKLGQLTDSIDAFSDAHRQNPDLLEPTYNLGILKFLSGDLVGAAVLLEEAALVDADDPRALEFLGYLYRSEGEWPQARRALYDALGRAPQSPRVLTALAAVELRIEGPDAAVKYLMQALEHNETYPPALYNLALVFRDHIGNQAQARSYFGQFLAVESEGERADRARAYIEQTKPAPKVVEQVAAPAPVEKPRPQKQDTLPPPAKPSAATPPKKPEAAPREENLQAVFDEQMAKAKTEFDAGNAQRALNHFFQAASEAQKRNRQDLREQALKAAVDAYFDQPRAHFAYGQFLREQGRTGAALGAFKRAAVLDPEWVQAHAEMAAAALDMGEFDAALIALRKVVQVDPANADALWMLATLYEDQLDLPGKAAQAYQNFQQLFPADPRALQAREKLKAMRKEPEPPKPAVREPAPPAPAPTPAAAPAPEPASGDGTREAVDLKEEARKLRQVSRLPGRSLNLKKPRVRNPRAAIQAYNRGTIYQSREDWERAIYYYRRACENDDAFVQAMYNLGGVYRMNGDLDLSKEAYLETLKLQPGMAHARYNLALIYWELKEYVAAEEQAKLVLRDDPEYKHAHYILGMVYARDQRTHDRAVEHYREFVRLAPADPAAAEVRRWLDAH